MNIRRLFSAAAGIAFGIASLHFSSPLQARPPARPDERKFFSSFQLTGVTQ